MLELIFQGFIEWIYSLVLECWNWFSTSLLDIMSLDLAYIRSHVPIITDIMQVLLAVGWALLLGNLVFQALKGMAAGLGFEAEDPKMLFGRSAVFSFLLLASPQICEIVLNMTSRIITLLQLPNAINVHLVDASILGNLLAGWLVVIICNIIIMWNVLKLLLKIAEQYVVLSTLTITAPLAFSMGGSKSTAPIFTGWCRMYGSMCLLMVTNVMFFKMLLSVMSAIPSGLDVFPWMVLIFSIVKVAKRMDDTITRIGLNPAQTGGGGGRSLPGMVAATVMHGAVSQVTKTIGGAIGGAVGAAGKGAVGAGTAAAGAAGGAVGAASAGLGSIFRPGRGQNTSQQSNSQQVHNQQSGPRQSTTQQSQQNMTNAGQPAPSQTVSPTGGMAYTGGPSSATSTSSSTGGNTSQSNRSSTTRHSRNSSVPSGTRRAPSYVRSTVSSQSGTAGTGTDSRSTETTVRGGSFGGSSRGGEFESGSRAGSFGGGSRGGSFGNGRRTTTTATTSTERDHDGSRGGHFGGGSGNDSGSMAGGSSRSSAASTIERNRSMIAKSGTTVEKTTTNTGSSQIRAGTTGTAAPHPGVAGNTSGGTTAPRPGMAGTTTGGTTAPRSGAAGTAHGGAATPHPGMAGINPGNTSAPRPGTAEIGTNTQTTHLTSSSKPGPETPATPRPGIAGTGINGQAAHRSGGTGSASGSPATPRPGTAGTSTGGPASPNPGAAGTGASTVAAKGQTVQPGAAAPHGVSTRSTRVTGKERANRAPISSGGAATPPATTTVQHTQSTESRSTRRSVTESKQTVTRNSAERAAHPSGTAGTAAPGTLRQPTATTQTGRVVPPVTGPQPPKQARSSPVQQETRQTSVPVKAPVGEASPVVRPGTAGTVPETRRGQTERATVRKAAEGEKAESKQPKAPGIKRQSTPPAAGKKPGPKTPNRSRGSGHG